MAEGRMLKRNISESRRLSELKTDSARLLWTWIIPFLDSEGRFYASPDMIKGKIVPRLSSFTIKNIPTYIEDMARVGLIVLYTVDGEKLLQYRKFDAFQKIKKDREAAPLPGPEKEDVVRIESGLDQDKVETTLSEEKLREFNLIAKAGEPPPASPEKEKKDPKTLTQEIGKPPGHFTKKITNQEILKDLTEVCSFWQGKNRFNPWQFVQKSQTKHPLAILHTLKRLRDTIQKGTLIGPEWPFATAICIRESKNYREEDAIKAHQEFMEAFKKQYPRRDNQ